MSIKQKKIKIEPKIKLNHFSMHMHMYIVQGRCGQPGGDHVSHKIRKSFNNVRVKCSS